MNYNWRIINVRESERANWGHQQSIVNKECICHAFHQCKDLTLIKLESFLEGYFSLNQPPEPPNNY
jgi:hypothetical protein